MARARNIKPGFYKNEDLAECSIWARFIFPGLWMLADREGRLEDRPRRIKGELLPFDSQDVEPLLAELSRRGFLTRYRNKDGAFIQIVRFSTHQTPHYSEKQSVIKPPELQETTFHDAALTPRTLPEHSENPPALKPCGQPPDSLNPDSLNPESRLSDSPNPESGKKSVRAARSISPGFAEFWSRYPRRTAKAKAEKAWQALDPDDALRITMLAALEDQKQSRQWSDPQFIPHPATWINQRRWEDEVPRETGDIASANERAAQTWLAHENSPPAIATLKPDALPDDVIVDFLNDWGHKLGVTQGADESETEFYAAVVQAVEVEANTGNADASQWLERYGEQVKAMVPA